MATISSINGNEIVINPSNLADKSIPLAKLSDDVTFASDNLKNFMEYYLGDVDWTESTYVTAQGVIVADVHSPKRYISSKIPCRPGSVVRFKAESDSANVAAISFWSSEVDFRNSGSNEVAFATVRNLGACDNEYTCTVPVGADYMILSGNANKLPLKDTYAYIDGEPYVISDDGTDGNVDEVLSALNTGKYYRPLHMVTGDSRYWSNETFHVQPLSATCAEFRSIDDLLYYDSSVYKCMCVGYDVNGNVVGYVGYYEGSTPVRFSELYGIDNYAKCRYELRRKDGATISGSEGLALYVIEDVSRGDGNSVKYVSASGSDDGDGTSANPYATVNKALSEGAETIMVSGGNYYQTINLGLSSSSIIEIRSADKTERPAFYAPDSLIGMSETKTDGYTKVYQLDTNKSFTSSNTWIFQDGAPDADTLISDGERHPLERGASHRCEDTKIAKCDASSLAAALTEIDGSDEYKWFYDSGTLYFSRPMAVTSDNPICGSFGTPMFANAGRAVRLIVSGIKSKYMSFNVVNTSTSEVIDCKASNVFANGAFVYNGSVGVKFIRCEASRCFKGATGDGFNAHSVKTGDARSKQTTCTLEDCWSHDNNDDGYSDHERSETTIIGGLFEWNGKGGVTPSYGSHCTCYNVCSRHNYNGFYYTGVAAEDEGGMYGQMACYGCISENNTRGDSGCGYLVDGSGNSAVLVGCKSIGNVYGYKASSVGNLRLVDCGSLNDNTEKSGNVTIQNTALVE